MDIAIVFGALTLLMLMGVPIAFSMGVAALIGYFLSGSWHITTVLSQSMYTGITSFILLAIPFYILAGILMNNGGTTMRILRFSRNLVGHIPGGLGHVNVVASMIFAGMSGSAVADVSGLGVIELKAMTDAGFDKKFSAAVTAASSTIGPIIPPSIPLVVFGGIASVSIGRLFLGGMIPGILMGLALMATVYFVSKKRGYPVTPRATFGELMRSTLDAILALMTVFIIMGGILFGIFTPTEAAVVASIYAFILGVFVFGDLKMTDIPRILWETVQNTVRVYLILAAAAAYTHVLTIMRVPEKVFIIFQGITGSPWLVMLIFNGLLLVLGCFMESISIILLVTPILMPIVTQIGVDPVHFGVMMTLNLMIGLVTPPVGMCLYVISVVAKLSIHEIMTEIWPYIIALLVVLGLITFIPALTLTLPNLLMGM